MAISLLRSWSTYYIGSQPLLVPLPVSEAGASRRPSVKSARGRLWSGRSTSAVALWAACWPEISIPYRQFALLVCTDWLNGRTLLYEKTAGKAVSAPRILFGNLYALPTAKSASQHYCEMNAWGILVSGSGYLEDKDVVEMIWMRHRSGRNLDEKRVAMSFTSGELVSSHRA